jgi:hypothetical protein
MSTCPAVSNPNPPLSAGPFFRPRATISAARMGGRILSFSRFPERIANDRVGTVAGIGGTY